MTRINLKFLIGFLSLSFVACHNASTKKNEYWLSKKKEFLFHDLKEFISDSSLRAGYKRYPTINNSVLDSAISTGQKYLYSWQQRDITKNDFTVILDDGEFGLKIFYLIFDKEDNLITVNQVAGKGSEGCHWFETKSKFLSKDTILKVGAITQWYNQTTKTKIKKTKGDSTFSYLIIDKEGMFKDTLISEKFEINFEKQLPR